MKDNHDYQLSVIVPVYNGEQYIECCMNSLFSQSIRIPQIILVDDGSTDASPQICDNYRKYDNVKVIHKKNEGIGYARNTGIEEAKFEYIGFVDIDDEIESNMYEDMLKYMQQTNASLVCCDILVVDKPLKREYELRQNFEERLYQGKEVQELIVKPLLGFTEKNVDSISSSCSKIFRKSVIDKNKLKFSNRTHGEDYQFLLEYLAVSPSIAFLHKTLYHYVHHSHHSLVTKFRKDYFETSVRSRLLMESIYPNLFWGGYDKVLEWNNIVYDAAIYYRLHCKGALLYSILKDMIPICSQYRLFTRYIERMGKSEKKNFFELQSSLSNSEKFCKLLMRITYSKYVKEKAKGNIRKLLRYIKYYITK